MKIRSLGLLIALGWCSSAVAQTPYFQGKTIRFIVGYPTGSTHDTWARLVGPYLTKILPGNPNTIVQNMPGAGSAVAANYVYSAAKPDGLSIAVVNALLYMWAATPYKTIQDVRAATTHPKCGSTGTGNTGYFLPRLLEETIGAKFAIVTGYQGGSEIELAVERGEVQCRAISI